MIGKKDFRKIHPVKFSEGGAPLSAGQFNRVNDYLWEIPKGFRPDMRVAARIFASEKILEGVEDEALVQLVNTSTLPGIVKYALAMPDIHSGYGPPIGGVGAMSLSEGVISPGFVGYDENCGCRLLLSDLEQKEIKPYLEKLAAEIQKQIPSGLGRGREVKLGLTQIERILEGGAGELVEQGYGQRQDIENCEEGGKISEADPSFVSGRAKERGRDQLGTLGSGNHFLEIQKVAEIFDWETAKKFGLFQEQIVVMVHTGSRGLGHQNCGDYLKIAAKAMSKYAIKIPDKELACLPFNSAEGQRFFKAMSAACNFAWANRQLITYYLRNSWQKVLGSLAPRLALLYDVAHNIAKIEEHSVEGEKVKLIVHRKGATRAFPGQPVLLPGSMGTASYVLVGEQSGEISWFSTAHGAGRTMSRKAASRMASGQQVINKLKRKGIIVKCRSLQGIAEEAPEAYKNIDQVVDVVHRAGLSKKVAKLIPLAVIKGE